MPSMAPPLIAETRAFISRAALLVKVTARIWLGHALRVAMRLARRAVRAEVLPVPAPARTSTGPSVVSTASRCGGLRPASQGASGEGTLLSGTAYEVGKGRRNGNAALAES